MTYLLDTNVLSEVRKANPNRNVQRWYEGILEDDIYLSVLVIGEIRGGVERLRRRDPEQAAGFDGWLAEVTGRYSDRILPVNGSIADRWGRLNSPQTQPVIDSLLAATAQVHALTLVTRNTKHVPPGTEFLNPFLDRET